MTQSRAPLILAIVLLLLPVMFVGSYLALVEPQGRFVSVTPGIMNEGRDYHFRIPRRVVHRRSEWTETAYWPLEQIDRKVRPEAWEPELPRYR